MTRARRPPPAAAASPFEAASGAHESELAAKLQGILDSLTDFDNGSITGILYRKPQNGVGSYEWIEECSPPFEFGNIFQEMKERFGGGQFELRIRAGGRIRGNLPFNIAREKERAATPTVAANPQGMTMGEMVTLLLAQQAEARREASDRSAATTAMVAAAATAVGPALIALFNRPPPAANQTSETIALITALQDRKGGGGGIKETLEAMAAFKQLIGPAEGAEPPGGFDPDNLIESGARLVGPAMKALGDYVSRMRGGGSEGVDDSASGTGAHGAPGQLALAPAASRFRLIELVRVDVTYGFERGHDPEKIADLVYDIILANNVTQLEIDELAAAFALSPTGLDDLAAEGIDLRARPQWAGEFFSALAAIHSEETADPGGGGGSPPDPATNGGARPPGDARPKAPKPSRAADNGGVSKRNGPAAKGLPG